MRKYAAFNPADGTYSYTESVDELKGVLAARAWGFFLEHTHGSPYTIVDVDEVTGEEIWYSPTGELLIPESEMQAVVMQAAQNISGIEVVSGE